MVNFLIGWLVLMVVKQAKLAVVIANFLPSLSLDSPPSFLQSFIGLATIFLPSLSRPASAILHLLLIF